MIKDFTDLEIWKIAQKSTLDIYKITSQFPKEEQYGLTNQLRRAVASIGANIAEGFGRYHYKENVKFLYNSRGSLAETRHFIILAHELKYIPEADMRSSLKELIRLSVKLNNYISSIKRKINE